MNKQDIETKAKAAISPLIQGSADNMYWGTRTDAGRSLPPYYLVYFLLVELLGFRNLGRWEKVAWSVPVSFEGRTLFIEHRKFGLGIFGKLPDDEVAAQEVARLINAGVRAAEPYFDFLAKEAGSGSNLNVENNSKELFGRFTYLIERYKSKTAEADASKSETLRTEYGFLITNPEYELRREARWDALSAIEAFFSWTEHVFIHLAIVQGYLKTGSGVSELAEGQWSEKFKSALDLCNPVTKRFYDDLLILRRRLRNFVAHGAFGKDGQALSFHSAVGAVPLLMPHRQGIDFFRFGDGINFLPADSVLLVNDFIEHLWSGRLAPAKIYIQESGLPLILTYALDGTYAKAMKSEKEMTEFTDVLSYQFDNYANMDF